MIQENIYAKSSKYPMLFFDSDVNKLDTDSNAILLYGDTGKHRDYE